MVKLANNTKCLCMLLLQMFAFALVTFGQQSAMVSPIYFKEIQLSNKQVSIHNLARAIHQQSGISFSYNALKINPNKKVKLSTNRLTIDQLLKELKRKTNIGHKQISPLHVVFIEPPLNRKKKTTLAKTKVPVVKDTNKKPVQFMVSKRDSLINIQVVNVGDSTGGGAYFVGGSNVGAGSYGGNVHYYPIVFDNAKTDIQTDNYNDLNQQYNSRLKNTNNAEQFLNRFAFASLGATTDEVFYLSPTAKAGFTFLYGTLAYGLHNSFSQIRYGIGSSLFISERMEVAAELNLGAPLTGPNTYSTTEIIPQDSNQPPVIIVEEHTFELKSRLTRGNLLINYTFNSNVMISFGLNFNYLTTAYLQNGNATSPAAMNPAINFDSRTYNLLTPPYQLNSTFSPIQSTYAKTWIGGQVGLHYRFGSRKYRSQH